jgi:hypothetical protein
VLHHRSFKTLSRAHGAGSICTTNTNYVQGGVLLFWREFSRVAR